MIGIVLGVLKGLSTASLRRTCQLAFWLGIGPHDAGWGETREEMEDYLAELPRDVIDRFQAFLQGEREISVPDDHPTRVANLPPRFQARAVNVAPRRFRELSKQEALEELISEEESELLLRFATWSGDIPRHVIWWYTPPDERPA
ncbi:MAG: hypothetical protein HY698_15370 [Deltaproteobacteria bacterium]|nr:hypothetical protein [Deltaproteobacteria bacterium]